MDPFDGVFEWNSMFFFSSENMQNYTAYTVLLICVMFIEAYEDLINFSGFKMAYDTFSAWFE